MSENEIQEKVFDINARLQAALLIIDEWNENEMLAREMNRNLKLFKSEDFYPNMSKPWMKILLNKIIEMRTRITDMSSQIEATYDESDYEKELLQDEIERLKRQLNGTHDEFGNPILKKL